MHRKAIKIITSVLGITGIMLLITCIVMIITGSYGISVAVDAIKKAVHGFQQDYDIQKAVEDNVSIDLIYKNEHFI